MKGTLDYIKGSEDGRVPSDESLPLKSSPRYFAVSCENLRSSTSSYSASEGWRERCSEESEGGEPGDDGRVESAEVDTEDRYTAEGE